MGLDGQIEHPRMKEAVHRVASAAENASAQGDKVIVGLGGFT